MALLSGAGQSKSGLQNGPLLKAGVRRYQAEMADTQNMLKVIAQDFIKSEHIQDVMPLYLELVAKTKEEPLCLSYELYVDQKDPGHFVFIEAWPDRAALDAHCNTEHFKRLVPLIDKHQRSPGTFLLMDAVE